VGPAAPLQTQQRWPGRRGRGTGRRGGSGSVSIGSDDATAPSNRSRRSSTGGEEGRWGGWKAASAAKSEGTGSRAALQHTRQKVVGTASSWSEGRRCLPAHPSARTHTHTPHACAHIHTLTLPHTHIQTVRMRTHTHAHLISHACAHIHTRT